MEENQKKLRQIKRIMNLCCKKSLSVDRYTIEERSVEDGMYLLMYVYNAKNEIIEARIASYDDMIEIAEKIRMKSKIHINQCNSIAHYIGEKYDIDCIVSVLNYRKDILKLELCLNKGIKTMQGTYSDIIDDLRYRKENNYESEQ